MALTMKIHPYIDKARERNWPVCIYGMGYLGMKLHHEIPVIFGLEPSLFCDGDDARVDRIDILGCKGIHRSELLMMKIPALVFVLVDDPYDKEIKESLASNENLHVLTIRELTHMDEVIMNFYGETIFNMYLTLPEVNVT